MTANTRRLSRVAQGCLPSLGGGFSLIELMVAITIGLLLLAGVTTLYSNIGRTNAEMAKTNSQIENGRLAIHMLQSDLMHAGFWGTYVPQFDDLTSASEPGDEVTAVPDPCLAYSAANWTTTYKNNLLGIPVQAYEDIPAGCAPPAPPAAAPAPALTNKKANTDVLVVRHAETCLPGVGNCAADAAGKLYFQSSLCDNELTATPPLRYVLDRTPATLPDTTVFTLKNRNCTGTPPAATVGVVADKREFVSNIYYIRDFAVTAGDGIPTLMRSSFGQVGGTLGHQNAVALIEGIEGFRVELGIDNISDVAGATTPNVNYAQAVNWADISNKTSPTNRGDGEPDTYVRCTTLAPCTVADSGAAAQLNNVVTVKLYLLVRNTESTPGYTDTKSYNLGSTTLGPFNDSFKRRVFSTTVRLVSVSGRRETP